MQVNMNSIGNYFTQQTRSISKVARSVRSESVQKSEIMKATKQPISTKEKEMFAKMYPKQKSEIMEYHYYQKNGVMSGVAVGSLVDRRG